MFPGAHLGASVAGLKGRHTPHISWVTECEMQTVLYLTVLAGTSKSGPSFS